MPRLGIRIGLEWVLLGVLNGIDREINIEGRPLKVVFARAFETKHGINWGVSEPRELMSQLCTRRAF